MNENRGVYFIGAFVYFTAAPADHPDRVRAVIRSLLADLGLDEGEVKLAQYRLDGHQGGWQKFRWSLIDEAFSEQEIGALDLLHGSPHDVRLTVDLQLRFSPALKYNIGPPWRFSFLSEASPEAAAGVIEAGRRLLRQGAEGPTPVSGGVFRAPTFNEGQYDVGGGHDRHLLPQWFQDRVHFDRRHDHELKGLARRLYPITLLGPALASQVSADALRAAGAAAVSTINGSLLIDAPGDVVETWDPDFLARTIELRRLLRPLTIKNPADAAGLD